MIGICLKMTDLDLFFDSSRDVAMATDFMVKCGYMRSFGRAAFENGLQYRHFDLKNQWQYIGYSLCTNDENRSSNSRDYEGNKCTFLDDTAKIGLSHRISHQLLDRSSPTFQHWYTYEWGLQNFHKFPVVQRTLLW